MVAHACTKKDYNWSRPEPRNVPINPFKSARILLCFSSFQLFSQIFFSPLHICQGMRSILEIHFFCQILIFELCFFSLFSHTHAHHQTFWPLFSSSFLGSWFLFPPSFLGSWFLFPPTNIFGSSDRQPLCASPPTRSPPSSATLNPATAWMGPICCSDKRPS